MEELDKRDWSYSELARQAGVASSTVSMMISGKRLPGWDLCAGIARAFNLSPIRVFAKAGLTPPVPGLDEDITFEQTLEIMRKLRPEQRLELLDYARWKLERTRSEASSKDEEQDQTAEARA